MALEILELAGRPALDALRPEWSRLEIEAGIEHPFLGYDWHACWYPAYCPADRIRVVTVRQAGRLRAVVPGLLAEQAVGALRFQTFSLAANGHTPRHGVLARPDDLEAVSAALNHLAGGRQGTRLVVLRGIEERSGLWRVLQRRDAAPGYLYREHAFEAPAFSLAGGWPAYLERKSRQTRQRLRQSLARCRDRGELGSRIFERSELGADICARVRRLDALSWQGQGGSGLFSDRANSEFYGELLTGAAGGLPVLVCLVWIDGQDVAYSLAVADRRTLYVLKYGYDPAFSHGRPGVVAMARFAEEAARRGYLEVDLCGEASEDKRRWETHRRSLANYWLVDRSSPLGWLLCQALRTRDACRQLGSRRRTGGRREAEAAG